jgi:hypothetical protein
MLNSRLCLQQTSEMIIWFVSSYMLPNSWITYIAKENLKLLHLLLDWEQGSLRCCESSFCAWVNHDNFCQNINNVISETTAAFDTYDASSWQADSSKDSPCLQLLVEVASGEVRFSEGNSSYASLFYFAVSTSIKLYWGRFTFCNLFKT